MIMIMEEEGEENTTKNWKKTEMKMMMVAALDTSFLREPSCGTDAYHLGCYYSGRACLPPEDEC
jgi:hypothetical protein